LRNGLFHDVKYTPGLQTPVVSAHRNRGGSTGLGQSVARARTINVRDLRKSNRARVLVELYMNGPMTRLEIGAAAEVSAATVSNLVGELITQGVVMEAGVEESEGGRPRVLLQVNANYANVIGVDVGETAVLTEVFDLGLQVLASHTSAPKSALRDLDEVVALILGGIERVVADSGVEPESILGVGVGVPGLVERGDDAVVHSQTVGWDGVPLGEMLRAGTSLPLVIDNGAKAFGQAEKWFGAAREAQNAIILLLGGGAGTAIITDGELYRGSSSSAGEWGHTTVTANGRICRCGASGCLEAYIGAAAVASRYDELSGSSEPVAREDVVSRIVAIAAAGPDDRAAAQLLEETAVYVGTGIADLINLFNPERIVVGGWMGALLGPKLLPRVREVAADHALRLPFRQVEIVAAELGRDAVALGAATLPISRFLTTGAVALQPRVIGDGRRRPAAVASRPLP
jgi:predicted NBD/HSP70 family sugar kinase